MTDRTREIAERAVREWWDLTWNRGLALYSEGVARAGLVDAIEAAIREAEQEPTLQEIADRLSLTRVAATPKGVFVDVSNDAGSSWFRLSDVPEGHHVLVSRRHVRVWAEGARDSHAAFLFEPLSSPPEEPAP